MGTINQNWTYSNNRYYNRSLLFKFAVVGVLLTFLCFKLIEVLMVAVPRFFSKSYDFTIIMIMISTIIFIFSVYQWVWKMKYNILNPSFRINSEMIEIDRKTKIQFFWEDVEQVIITNKVEFIGMLYNMERNAILFKLNDDREEFIIIDKGIYIRNFDKFYSLLLSYIPEDKVIYKNDGKHNRLEQYIDWISKKKI